MLSNRLLTVFLPLLVLFLISLIDIVAGKIVDKLNNLTAPPVAGLVPPESHPWPYRIYTVTIMDRSLEFVLLEVGALAEELQDLDVGLGF